VYQYGKPIAMIMAVMAVSEDNLEESLDLMRRLRAMMAVEELQRKSSGKGLSKLPPSHINAEIRAARQKRPP